MNWAKRHLNWTLFFGVWAAGFTFYIFGFIVALLLEVMDPLLPPFSPFTVPAIAFALYAVLLVYMSGWHVQRKGRNLWNAVWILVPLGLFVLLCLKNLTEPAKPCSS